MSLRMSLRTCVCEHPSTLCCSRCDAHQRLVEHVCPRTHRKEPCLYLLHRPQDQVLQRSFAMERLTSVTATADGMLLAGGGASGAVYVWETASGRLLRNWPAHYKVGMSSLHTLQ